MSHGSDSALFPIAGKQDLHIRFYDTGADGRPAVVLLHGIGGCSAIWAPIADALAADFRVIRVDLLGHGESGKPRDGDYSMAAQAGYVRELLDGLNLEHLALVGASYGGGVALEIAKAECKAERSRLAGVTVIGGTCLNFTPPPSFRNASNPLSRFLIVNFGSANRVADILLKGSFWRVERISKVLREQYATPLRTRAARRAVALAARAMFAELRARTDNATRYRGIACPTLLVWGEQDHTVPIDVSNRLAAQIPHAKQSLIPDCGHTPHEECPTALLDVLRPFFGEIEATVGSPGL